MFKNLSYLIMILTIFLGCEKEQPMETFENDSGVSQTFYIPSKVTTTGLPDDLRWHWRRVMVQGDMRTHGSDNVNGAPSYSGTGEITSINANVNSNNGWYDTLSVGGSLTFSSSNPYLGAYNLVVNNCYAESGSSSTNNKFDLGETIAAYDSFSVTFAGKDNAAGSALFGITVGNEPPGWTLNNFFSLTNSWDEYELTSTGASEGWTFIFLRIGGYNRDVSGDDFRIYSEASDLVPVCRIEKLVLKTGQIEGWYYFSGEVSGWDEKLEEGTVTIAFLYEDPDDGLYYEFTTSEWEISAQDEDFETEDFQLTSGASSVLSSEGEIRILTFTQPQEIDGYYKHINEYDAIVYED